MMRKNIFDIQNKKGKQPIISVSAYSYPIAKILDNYCDIILVGDSLAMAIYGMKDTLSVSLDMMINHTKAVVAATKTALVIVDMPFGSYEQSPSQAFESAAKIISATGANAVKLESGEIMAPTIEFLVQRGIPVMGHIGLLPQHINKIGGYKIQGKSDKEQKQIMEDALKIQDAGAFALVIEGVVKNLAEKITQKLSIPTIGIGASQQCDGQILVIDDLLGLNQEFKPKFVKNYAHIAEEIKKAVEIYAREVLERKFPGKEHCFED